MILKHGIQAMKIMKPRYSYKGRRLIAPVLPTTPYTLVIKMMKSKSILSEVIEQIRNNQTLPINFKFRDNNYNLWEVDLESEFVRADDQDDIPENKLTDDDYEECPHCRLIKIDDTGYNQFSSFGENQYHCLLDCLYQAELISWEDINAIDSLFARMYINKF
jgi:hypothetical protein